MISKFCDFENCHDWVDGYKEYVYNNYCVEDVYCNDTEIAIILQESEQTVENWLRHSACTCFDDSIVCESIYIMTFYRNRIDSSNSESTSNPDPKEWQRVSYRFLENQGYIKA